MIRSRRRSRPDDGLEFHDVPQKRRSVTVRYHEPTLRVKLPRKAPVEIADKDHPLPADLFAPVKVIRIVEAKPPNAEITSATFEWIGEPAADAPAAAIDFVSFEF